MDVIFIDTVSKEWIVEVQVNETTIKLKVDTGAQANIITVKELEKLGIDFYEKSTSCILSYQANEM